MSEWVRRRQLSELPGYRGIHWQSAADAGGECSMLCSPPSTRQRVHHRNARRPYHARQRITESAINRFIKYADHAQPTVHQSVHSESSCEAQTTLCVPMQSTTAAYSGRSVKKQNAETQHRLRTLLGMQRAILYLYQSRDEAVV